MCTCINSLSGTNDNKTHAADWSKKKKKNGTPALCDVLPFEKKTP